MSTINLPDGLATINVDDSSGSPVIVVSTPVGGGPPSGIATYTVDTNVTKAFVTSTIAALAQILGQM